MEIATQALAYIIRLMTIRHNPYQISDAALIVLQMSVEHIAITVVDADGP
jgi:hypothetical protein